MTRIIHTLLSGGFGTRLWPLSRPDKPKQFLPIFEGKSLFQHTVLRNETLTQGTMLLTNENHYRIAREQMEALGRSFDHVVLEPVPRNTAPAITLAALSVEPEDILFVTPSDHMISGDNLYAACVKRALELAREGYLVTFSIAPAYPETGYGYIEVDGEEVLSFREKPDLRTAKLFLEKGNFYWNSGMFCFKAGVFLEEIQKHSPAVYEASVKAHKEGITSESMQAIPEDSVDYAVFEKSERIRTVPSDFVWSDLGTFDAIVRYFSDATVLADGMRRIEGVNVENSYAFSSKKVLGIDLKDIVVIDTDDTVLVLPSSGSQGVKEVFKRYS